MFIIYTSFSYFSVYVVMHVIDSCIDKSKTQIFNNIFGTEKDLTVM